jgi:uncharacterized protein YqhQ
VNVSYGGQAVIEGVMMRGPTHMVLSVRGPDGKVVSLTRSLDTLAQRNKIARWPVVRGAISMWESLSLGIKMLMKSAEIAAPEEEQPSETSLSLAVLFALVVGVGLFIAFPTYVAPWLMKGLGVSGRVWASSVESGLRLVMLLIYVVSISRMEDIQRVLEYHGAEHKVIWAYEKNTDQVEQMLKGGSKDGGPGDRSSEGKGSEGGDPEESSQAAIEFLVQEAAGETTLHPRCGTSFLFIAVLVTWIVFLFVSPGNAILRLAARLAMLPVIAGLAYEVLKNSSRREGLLWDLVKAPGIGMQKLTTRQPDKDQLEVAATSLVLLILAEADFGETRV